MITVEFSDTGSIPGNAVKLFTWSWAPHVDFVLPDGSLLGARPSCGVAVVARAPARRVERFEVDAPDAVLANARSQVGRPYDWAGVLGVALHRDWRATDSWFCSELIAWAFAEAGYPILRSDTVDRITPRDLLLSPLLRPVAAPPLIGGLIPVHQLQGALS